MNQLTLTVDISTDGIKSALKLLHAAAEQFGGVDKEPVVTSGSGQKVKVDTNLLTEGFDLPSSESDSSRDIEDDGERISDIAKRAVNPGGVELDADGLPHDPRIHGASRLKTKKDSKWKRIKNLDKNSPGLVEKVEAELRAALAATPASDVETTPPPADTEETAPPPADTESAAPPPPANKETAAPPPPTEPEVVKYLSDGKEWTKKQLLAAKWSPAQIAALDVVETKTSNEPMTIADLMEKVPTALVKGTITQDDIDKALAKEGIANMPALYARPDLVPAIATALFG